MMNFKRTSAVALLASSLALGSVAGAIPAMAAPAAAKVVTSQAVSTDSNLVQVRDGHRRHWRGGHRHRHRGYDNTGAWIGLGIAGALLADGLSDSDGYYDEGYSSGYSSDGGMERCAATFRSFEPETGLYTTYGGEKRPCPYLG